MLHAEKRATERQEEPEVSGLGLQAGLAPSRLTESRFGDTLTVTQIGLECEPISDDFEGSRITVPVGAQQVPGLTEALPE